MSLRLTKKPMPIPSGVEIKLDNRVMTVKGPKDTLTLEIDQKVDVKLEDNNLIIKQAANDAAAITGTTCAHIKNMMIGVVDGFEKKLVLVGVGYRASLKGKDLHLNLGYSHPIDFVPPKGVTIEVPSQTEIVVKGSNKEAVGQAAAEIRAFRSPEPYKGKGVKYADEIIIRKETKKK